jgi:hypothetical protein
MAERRKAGFQGTVNKQSCREDKVWWIHAMVSAVGLTLIPDKPNLSRKIGLPHRTADTPYYSMITVSFLSISPYFHQNKKHNISASISSFKTMNTVALIWSFTVSISEMEWSLTIIARLTHVVAFRTLEKIRSAMFCSPHPVTHLCR